MRSRKISHIGIPALMVAAAIAYAASAADEGKDGWISLFDGKTLNNWKANGKAAEGAFTVEDGMIVAHGQGVPTCSTSVPFRTTNSKTSSSKPT